MDRSGKKRRRRRRRNNTHTDEAKPVLNIDQTNFIEGYRKCMEEWKLSICPSGSSTVPISFHGLPRIVESVFEFVRWNCGPRLEHLSDEENLIVWIKCLLFLAQMKTDERYQVGPYDNCSHSYWLPYPIALYLQCIGTFQFNEQEVRPCLIEHRIKLASGALNYSIPGLNAIIDECKSFRSKDHELVQVAQELIKLPGFRWEEYNSDNTVRIHPDSVSSYSPMNPTRSDWDIFQSTLGNMRMGFERFRMLRSYFRPWRLRNMDDGLLLKGSHVQAVRFPKLGEIDGRIRYYINQHVPEYLEKLSPALMLGFESGGVTVSRWRSSIEHCFIEGVGNTLHSLNALVRASNDEFRTDAWDPMKGYEVPLFSTCVDSLPKISGPTVARIPVSFRALPELADLVWRSIIKHGMLDDAELKNLQFLKLVLIYAEIKLAYAQHGTPAFSSDQEVRRIHSLLNEFIPISSRSSSSCVTLPFQIKMYLDHLGPFCIQNQTVVPQLIEHDIKEASGAINYSYSGLVTLMNACSKYQNVDADIMKVALANVSEKDLPYVKWEVDPTDPNRKRISPSTIKHWSFPSGEELSSWMQMSASLFWDRYETCVACSVDLTTGKGSSAQAVRFPSPFNSDGDLYMNVNVSDENVKLASAFKFGYEHGGVLFSRFCSSYYNSLRIGDCGGWNSYRLCRMNEASRRFVDSSDSD